MRYLCANIERLRDTQMLPTVPIVDPGANGGLDFLHRIAPVFAGDLFYIFVRHIRSHAVQSVNVIREKICNAFAMYSRLWHS